MTTQSPFARMRRLHQRGPRSRGLAVDREGVTLGPDAVLVRRTPAGYRCAKAADVERLTRLVFAGDARLRHLPHVLTQIARALDAGDLVKAQLLGLEIPIGELDDGQLARLAAAADLLKAGFDPSQPRDERGRWSSDGGGGDGAGDETGTNPVQIANARDGVSDAGGILPVTTDRALDTSGTSPAARATIPPPSRGAGSVREYSPEEAAGLPAPPPGSKYVTLSDGSVLWSAYSNHGTGAPMLMPKDVSLADNARVGQKVQADYFESAKIDPNVAAGTSDRTMISLFRRGGAMDYQRIYSTDGKINKDYIDIGNYNYGVVAAAAGYSWTSTKLFAGGANLGGGGERSWRDWFNNPRNLAMFKKGYNDYRAGRIIPPEK